jgi:peptidoglycan/LPS O-acetylase OafA/YrhL
MNAHDETMPEAPSRGRRVEVIDGLRGLASFAVCWYHLVFANGAFLGAGILAVTMRNSAENMWVGVEVFFVISGFVIPLALYRSNYSVSRYGTFMLKRIVRLDPPYLVSVALCVALWYLSARLLSHGGAPFTLTLPPLLAHLGYVNAFLGYQWLNPVYWTLAIEFQYYLGIGLLFVALVSRQWPLRLAALAVMGVLAFLVPDGALVFHYLFVFILGMLTFQYFVGLLSLRAYLPSLGVAAIGCHLTLGPMVTGVALATALIIAFVRRTVPGLRYLGAISYSLYLVHVPIGGRLMNLGMAHVHGTAARCLVLIGSLAVTIGAAALLYRLVERPAQHWSSAIGYRGSWRPSGRRRMGGDVVTGIAEP